ncbi:helix-turn-helix domain-containing protein [Capnocytophaga felis]|uniref:HTH cro/C1-type domain-containing protein n=1 Tax=Capnocytophaga felis TaxID=2267611 RepID=A0A5M4B7G6_9FLAO|nr:helix-turn-helix transcriptional regulator [Capnocytophaga felis]GET45197.1 hypothetical protein RCZ01_04990 [Capnocytophaga felis]GET47639.1 hypothetical protein RCZ02_04700 [Capnocytophaga felis]
MNKIARTKLNWDKIAKLPTADQLLTQKYGEEGTPTRKEFTAKAKAWYFAELLKEERKQLKITQRELAEKIGKKREYIASLERGETDMQLSTFISIAEALGLKFGLMYQ